jgi:uncharacterized protein (UPF0276 family)
MHDDFDARRQGQLDGQILMKPTGAWSHAGRAGTPPAHEGRGAVPGIAHRAGVGLKAEHYRAIIETRPDIGFFEVHAENFMGAGGPPHRHLTAIRERHALSLHGVGLSIGSAGPLDTAHLRRLRALIDRYQPALFSEHLAWSSHKAGYFGDLLPLPYTDETLALVCRHIDQVQTTLRRQMLLENPATYVGFDETTWRETDFIAEIVRRTGCALLLDVNNVHVACTNRRADARRYIDDFPLGHVRQIHLAGHARRTADPDCPLLIDSHDRPVDDAVWALFGRVVNSTGPLPTLIEWDADIPAWPELYAQARQAEAFMAQARIEEPEHAALV